MVLNRVPIPEKMQPIPRTEPCDLAASITVPIPAEEKIICGIWKNHHPDKIQSANKYLNKDISFPVIARFPFQMDKFIMDAVWEHVKAEKQITLRRKMILVKTPKTRLPGQRGESGKD